jgi:hypothetical protein
MASYHEHQRRDASICSTQTRKRSNGSYQDSSYFSQIAVHEGWNSYFKYEQCQHVLCNAPIFFENFKTSMSKRKKRIGTGNDVSASVSESKKRSNQRDVDVSTLVRIKQEYEQILQKGYRLHPDNE